VKNNPRISGGFGMVSKAVMSDPRLNTTVKALYAYLSTYADGLTNELTVSVNRMAAELGITPPTVKRNLKLLEESGVIKRIPNGVMTTRITVLLK
jgi:DNA-binding MarR family transcriptional regulator